jgi:hypothetical protein
VFHVEEMDCVVGKNGEKDLRAVGDEDQDACWERKRWQSGMVLVQVSSIPYSGNG